MSHTRQLSTPDRQRCQIARLITATTVLLHGNARQCLLDRVEEILVLRRVVVDAQLLQLRHVAVEVVVSQRVVRRGQRDVSQRVDELTTHVREVVVEPAGGAPYQLVLVRVLLAPLLQLADLRPQCIHGFYLIQVFLFQGFDFIVKIYRDLRLSLL